MQQMIFIADFIACSTCFGQYYAHHQQLEYYYGVEPKFVCSVCGLQLYFHIIANKHVIIPTNAHKVKT